MASHQVVLRPATDKDVEAILALLLTSFREFPLFDILYSPLRKDLDYSKDTVFFWGRRVKLALADPNTIVLVSEIHCGNAEETLHDLTISKDKDEDAWKMLEWCEREGLRQENSQSNNLVVGFAIWRFKGWSKKLDFKWENYLQSNSSLCSWFNYVTN
jgi:hypothetical protein